MRYLAEYRPAKTQSRSQSFRYPCLAERENENPGSNHFEITEFCPSTLSFREPSFITLRMFKNLDLPRGQNSWCADQKERGLWGREWLKLGISELCAQCSEDPVCCGRYLKDNKQNSL